MIRKSGKSILLQAITVIDPATGWIEIRIAPSARVYLVSNQVKLACLTRYPLPNKVIMDRGNKFPVELKEMIINDYGITVKSIASRKTQAYAMLAGVQQTIGNILLAFKVQNMVLDDKNPWDCMLASNMFAMRATVYTIMQYNSFQ